MMQRFWDKRKEPEKTTTLPYREMLKKNGFSYYSAQIAMMSYIYIIDQNCLFLQDNAQKSFLRNALCDPAAKYMLQAENESDNVI